MRRKKDFKKFRVKENREISPTQNLNRGKNTKEHKRFGNKRTNQQIDAHTSSIPSLPSVVRHSRLKENTEKQSMMGLRRRLYQKDGELDEIYRELEEVQDHYPDVKSSVEIPYLTKGGQQSFSNNTSSYSRYKIRDFKSK